VIRTGDAHRNQERSFGSFTNAHQSLLFRYARYPANPGWNVRCKWRQATIGNGKEDTPGASAGARVKRYLHKDVEDL